MRCRDSMAGGPAYRILLHPAASHPSTPVFVTCLLAANLHGLSAGVATSLGTTCDVANRVWRHYKYHQVHYIWFGNISCPRCTLHRLQRSSTWPGKQALMMGADIVPEMVGGGKSCPVGEGQVLALQRELSLKRGDSASVQSCGFAVHFVCLRWVQLTVVPCSHQAIPLVHTYVCGVDSLVTPVADYSPTYRVKVYSRAPNQG
jgi:hypothetical protein